MQIKSLLESVMYRNSWKDLNADEKQFQDGSADTSVRTGFI